MDKRMIMKNLLSVILLLLLQITVRAQFLDSLQIQAGTNVTVATKGYQPLWLVSNRWGVIADRKSDFTTHFRITNSNRLGTPVTIYDDNDPGIYISYGADIYNNNTFGKTLIQEAFIKGRYKNLTLSGGRFKQIIGEVDPDLSSGSLGVSGNALPIAKINLALEYTDLPFTNGWIQFKGLFSHGWMGEEQFMKKAFLHEKNIYFRLGKNKLKLYAGVQHYAVWGGSRPDFFSTDRSLKGWLDVVTGIEINDGTVVDGSLPNRPGDQRGVIELGGEWENDNVKFQLNSQTPFDSGQGIDIRNIDRLLSLNITNKVEGGILKKLTLEFLHTTQSNDFYNLRYRESYYNNGIYRTGWEYNDRIIGTPLFTNRWRAAKYFNTIKPFDWDAPQGTISSLDNIINNRIVGGHVAALLALNDHTTSKTLITYTKNFGDNRLNGVFSPFKIQWYTMEEVSYHLPNTQLSFTGAIAYDFGDLSTNFGTMIGVQWQLKR
jgi:hypothetical protein